MLYDFTKIHGAGNDFVFIEDMKDQLHFTPEQIAEVCDRHFGVGGDGLILVKPSNNPQCDAFMCYYNSDGSVAQMCGNGVRCFAKYLVDNKLVDVARGYVDVDTLAGAKHIEFELDGDEKLVLAKVNMGQPILDPATVPTTLQATKDGAAIEVPVKTPFGTLKCTTVSMGNPHCVIFMDSPEYFENPASFAIAEIGAFMECNEIFPEKCNIEFAYVDERASEPTILMRVWERGCGETLACGTGACATGVAAYVSGRADRVNKLRLLGGTLTIEYREDGVVLMTGPAATAFVGQVEI